MLRKKFETFKSSRSDTKTKDSETKSNSTTNLHENTVKTSKKYDHYPSEKLIKIIKCLKKENKILKDLNEKQANEIKLLSAQLSKLKVTKEENSPRPQSCLRTSNSVPKKNRVMFSRDLVHILNETEDKYSKTMKSAKVKEDPISCYTGNAKRISKKGKVDGGSPIKNIEESEYYTSLSSSLQEKKNISQSMVKNYESSPKGKEKQRLFIKVQKY
ncbi:hypothetical protein SteCoe_7049 [Stentor coeruleus]|uniref:Uncharacterized protein n=1 Tax=Stentor coeruleus TaxID=5963 RepID=A0A1R2CNL4_9CILI|nr:hypothetical protein SteCoe_7049 [Stentor coeruleus]